MHRDLKPLNMMLDDEFNLKLVSRGSIDLMTWLRLTLAKQSRFNQKVRNRMMCFKAMLEEVLWELTTTWLQRL